MDLMQASNQYFDRPPDERFESLATLLADAKESEENSHAIMADSKSLKVKPVGTNGIALEGNQVDGVFTNFAFGQLARRLEMPATAFMDQEGVPKITSELAAEVLNQRLQKVDNHPVQLYAEQRPGHDFCTVKSLTTDKYARVCDSEIIPQLNVLERNGWKVPPARPVSPGQPGSRKATAEDVVGLDRTSNGRGWSVQEGDWIAPAGLYRGDRDMFVFMIDGNPVDDGFGNGLGRGIFVSNSEVGYRGFSITEFMYQFICGNHIVWGAQDVVKYSRRHVGEARDKIMESLVSLTNSEPRTYDNERRVIEWMRNNFLGTELDEVIQSSYKLLEKVVTKKDLRSAYEISESHINTDGSPNSFAGLANGLTRLSQLADHADKRMQIDAGAANLYQFSHTQMLQEV